MYKTILVGALMFIIGATVVYVYDITQHKVVKVCTCTVSTGGTAAKWTPDDCPPEDSGLDSNSCP